jgi:hypothetical protein
MATGRRSVGELPIAEQAIWDVVASAGGESSGGNSILAGLPPDVAGPSESIEVRLDSTEENVHIEPANVAEEVRVALGGSAESRGTFAEEKDLDRITGGKQWSIVRWLLQKKQWKYLHMVDAGASRRPSIRDANPKQPDYAVWLDEQIGAALELMEEPTVLLVMSCCAGSEEVADDVGVFVVVAPECPLSGEYEGARLIDIAPTLLDLAGYEIPGSMEGRSLVAGLKRKKSDSDDHESEQERLIRERLSGLGYI